MDQRDRNWSELEQSRIRRKQARGSRGSTYLLLQQKQQQKQPQRKQYKQQWPAPSHLVFSALDPDNPPLTRNTNSSSTSARITHHPHHRIIRLLVAQAASCETNSRHRQHASPSLALHPIPPRSCSSTLVHDTVVISENPTTLSHTSSLATRRPLVFGIDHRPIAFAIVTV